MCAATLHNDMLLLMLRCCCCSQSFVSLPGGIIHQASGSFSADSSTACSPSMSSFPLQPAGASSGVRPAGTPCRHDSVRPVPGW